MQYFPFDSKNPLYKSKQTAVAAGETLRLRLLLHKDALCFDAFLILESDFDHTVKEIKLEPGEWLEDYRFYSCDISLDTGLYWYKFRYTSPYGEFYVTKFDHSLGYVSRDGGDWQITVYEETLDQPDWLGGGIIYQIFPDRFFNSGSAKIGVPDDRYLCDDWDKIPEHRQTQGICSLCNDYYGGDLKGIEAKLDYIKSLGVNCIYLNPIFEAHSNHRYNTADYTKIDSLLGSEKDFVSLCKAAKKKGIHIVLDGVFSHTGDDSIYFNKYSRYSTNGAYNSTDSPYYSWYKFKNWPDSYHSWWGVPTLPEVIENDEKFTEYITGENGILKKWLKLGADGWRLDVADELPDEFLDKIKTAIKSEKPNAYLLGEVWEDATNKISYSYRRRFLLGKQLDSVMNYPFANGIISFVKGGNSRDLIDLVLDILENYPPNAVNLLMNHIGTHDTCRILTVLGADNIPPTRNEQACFTLTNEQYALGVKRLKLAATLQYTLPGVPSLFYGDEAGVTGGADPFCRATYPWGNENKELLEFYKTLGKIRISHSAFNGGKFIPLPSDYGVVNFVRQNDKSKVFIAVNRNDFAVEVAIPSDFTFPTALLGNEPYENRVTLEPYGISIITNH